MTEKKRMKMYEQANALIFNYPGQLTLEQTKYLNTRCCETYTAAHNDATAIIETLEKAIRRAQKYERQQVMEDWGNPGFDGTEGTIRIQTSAGCAFILPLLKKLIEDRDNYIRLCEHFEKPYHKDSEIRVCNKEIMELLGENHE